tara:strand:+ start:7060 stop:7788 length:729 start_codon:yes stop_codon:yes gene_type:complete
MKIPKRSDMVTSQIAGRNAKKAGHEFEHRLALTFDNLFGGKHKVDGRSNTKVDIVEENSNWKYSVKSASKNHTQVGLYSTSKWIEHFKLEGTLCELFLTQFFGYPNKEQVSIVQKKHPKLKLTDKEIHQNRVYKENIETKVSAAFLRWINTNKMEVLRVIVERGFSGESINTLIWHRKGTENITMIPLQTLQSKVKTGKWTLNNTTAEFRTKDGEKLFHLQMKGSGKKYTSGYHGMMFHIYR